MGQADLILVGASVRAMAQSVRRAGYKPWCIDLFADADLQAIAAVQRCPWEDYPSALVDLLMKAPQAPWMYTGGLENHPNIIQQMASARPLWGNSIDVLQRCRSPLEVQKILHNYHLPCLTVQKEVPHDPERWLRKPFRSAGGNGIRFGTSMDRADVHHYFQRYQPGAAYAGLFLGTTTDCHLLGVTQQLIGEPSCGAKAFQYAGSLGPIDLPQFMQQQLETIGQVLVQETGLRGLFGIDWIAAEDQVWLVEINPRYTASMELLEQASDCSWINLQRCVFEEQPLPKQEVMTYSTIFGKAIVYATKTLTIPTNWPNNWNGLADIPHAGDTIEAGWPICTILAKGSTLEACQQLLHERVQRLRANLQTG